MNHAQVMNCHPAVVDRSRTTSLTLLSCTRDADWTVVNIFTARTTIASKKTLGAMAVRFARLGNLWITNGEVRRALFISADELKTRRKL